MPALMMSLIGLLSSLKAAAEPSFSEDQCLAARCPGASLLVPYFEVDLEHPYARTTMLSIGNDGPSAVVRVVLWTNWGLPVLGFDLNLGEGGVQTVHLGALLKTGVIPSTGLPAPDGFEGCLALDAPALDPSALEALRARLAGQPDPSDGRCWAGSATEGLATGYVTVDVVRRCSTSALYPGDEGYFADDTSGVASDENVLFGDFFLLGPGEHQAAGFQAVPLVADAGRFASDSGGTFYGYPFEDHRSPLRPGYQSRLLTQPPLQTDLLLWTEGQPCERYPTAGPRECGSEPRTTWAGVIVDDERADQEAISEFETSLRTQRFDALELVGLTAGHLLGGLPPLPGYGSVRLCTKRSSAEGFLSPEFAFQSWLGQVHSLGDRFSIGYEASTARNLAFFCSEASPPVPCGQ